MAADHGGDDMATAAMALARDKARYFYVWMALANAAIAFGGFAPTYWLQLPAGTFVGSPMLHLHAALFSAWTLLLLSQTMLAAQGRLYHHRAWGLGGISLATAMLLVGLAAAIGSMNAGLAAGYGDRSLAFAILPVSSILVFAGFFAVAVANINRPEWHKRFVLVATVSLLQAAVARIFFVLATGGGPGARPGLGPPPPVSIGLAGGLIVDLLIVAGMIFDWRTRGRAHRAWLIGLAVTLSVQILRGPISTTAPWLAVARTLSAFG
jgi:hypothetical protein